MNMATKTSDLCDEHEGVEACTTPFAGWGKRRRTSSGAKLYRTNSWEEGSSVSRFSQTDVVP